MRRRVNPPKHWASHFTVIAVVILCSSFGTTAKCEEPPQSCEFPISGDGSAIVVAVNHGENRYRFLMDTGSDVTVLDSSTFQSRLKLLASGETNPSKGKLALPSYRNPGDLLVEGCFLVKTDPIQCIDLSLVSGALGEKLHGILGCDFLNQCVITADVDRGQLCLSKSVEADHEGVCIELTRDKLGRPTFRARFNDLSSAEINTDFLLDTGRVGLEAVVLRKELFNSCVDHGLLSVDGVSQVAAAYGKGTGRIGTLRQFSVWNDLQNIRVREGPDFQPNLLGLSYLMQFNFELDLRHSKLYLEPRKTKIDLIHLKNHSGLGFKREGLDIVVVRVDPSSPAFSARIRDGDVITTVDGVPSQDLRLHPLRVSLCEEGKTVRLGLKRVEQEWTVDLQLRDWRQPVTEKDFE